MSVGKDLGNRFGRLIRVPYRLVIEPSTQSGAGFVWEYGVYIERILGKRKPYDLDESYDIYLDGVRVGSAKTSGFKIYINGKGEHKVRIQKSERFRVVKSNTAEVEMTRSLESLALLLDKEEYEATDVMHVSVTANNDPYGKVLSEPKYSIYIDGYEVIQSNKSELDIRVDGKGLKDGDKFGKSGTHRIWATVRFANDEVVSKVIEYRVKEVQAAECNEGERKCVGYDLYECKNGQWTIVEKNSKACGYTPPECSEGETMCKGYDLYVCQNGKWVLKEQNSASCGYEPPECEEGAQKCEGYNLYVCENGKWVLKEENSKACGYPECNEGERKCYGYDLYECQNGRWVLIEQFSEKCGYTPPACKEGEQKCLGRDLYVCQNGKWVLKEKDSSSCPECNEGEQMCVGYSLYECQNGKWVLIESFSKKCGYTPPPEQPVETGIAICAYYPSNYTEYSYDVKVQYNDNEYWGIRVTSMPEDVTEIGRGKVLFYYKNGEYNGYADADIYATKCGYIVAHVPAYNLIVQTIYPVLAELYINNNEVEWDRTAKPGWTEGSGVTLHTGTNTIQEIVNGNTVLSTNFDIPGHAMYATVTFVPKDNGCYDIQTYWNPYPPYPYIVRENCKVKINGEWRSPGTYTVKEGAYIDINAFVTTCKRQKLRAAILANGKMVYHIDREGPGGMSFSYYMRVYNDTDITIAAYAYDETSGTYKKTDEYGVWSIKVGSSEVSVNVPTQCILCRRKGI